MSFRSVADLGATTIFAIDCNATIDISPLENGKGSIIKALVANALCIDYFS